MEDKEIKIDYLSVTFPLVLKDEDNELVVVMDTVKMISNYLQVDYLEVKREEYSTLRYRYQYNLGDSIILRLSGPENDTGYRTCHLELKGEGCRDFERRNQNKNWSDFFYFLLRLNGKFKRIDVAIDDKSGCEITIKQLYDKIQKGKYTSSFHSIPKPVGFIDSGFSLTFGTGLSPTQLCIYDKRIEQLNKNKLVNEDYWIRYEMRFRESKAETVIYNLLTQYEDSEDDIYGFDMRKFAYEMLYSLLDIKEDNNYGRIDQTKMQTDKLWMNFLCGVQKGLIKNPDEKVFSYESSFNWIEPKASFYLLIRLAQCKENFESFFYEMLKVLYRDSNLNNERLKKFNKFLYQMNVKPYSPEQFLDFRNKIFSKIEDMEMPF